MDKYKNLYQNNANFKEYVDRFCNSLDYRHMTLEQILNIKVVMSYGDYLIGDKNG